MADDNIYDSEEDEEYKPDVEKAAKESRKDGKKGQQLEFSRPGRARVNSTSSSVEDPLAKLKTDAQKSKINAIWEQLNSKVSAPSARSGHGGAVPDSGTRPKAVSAAPGWMKNLGMAPKKSASEPISVALLNGAHKSPRDNTEDIDFASERDKVKPGDENTTAETIRRDEARKVASAALAAAKAAAKATTDGKVEINEIRDFAGEEIRVTKYVDPSSKAAVAARRKAEMQSVSSPGLDALLQQIGKKQKLNVLDKSRKDWGEFKEETGIEEELEMHIKSGDKYTEKVAFLQRADIREYEKERDARLAMASKRRSEATSAD